MLTRPLRPLRAGELAPGLDALRPLQIAPCAIGAGRLTPGLVLRGDPTGPLAGQWRSPRARLLEVRMTPRDTPMALALHVTLDAPDLGGAAYLGFVARTAATEVMGLRAAIRSGLPGGGAVECAFDRHILSRPGEGDHHDLFVPVRQPDLPARAPWREFVIRLPPLTAPQWALHDLRVFALWD